MCRNHRGFIEAIVAALEARRRRAVPQHRLRRPAAGRRRRAREARGDRLRRGVRGRPRARPAAGASGFVAWHDEPGAASAPTARSTTSSRDGDRADLSPPAEPGKAIILTSGTTGTPKGARALAAAARSTRPPRCSRAIPLQGAREDDDRRAAVPRLGLRALHARAEPRLDASCCGASSTPRPPCRSPRSTSAPRSSSCR